MKKAVIYFSYEGNTLEAAEKIAKKTGADLIQIETVEKLPEDRNVMLKKGAFQAMSGAKPEIKDLPALDSYDELILGSPVWAGVVASPVNTFLKNCNCLDKITAVFTLSGSGRNERCIKKLSKILPNLEHQVSLFDRKSEGSKKIPELVADFVSKIH